ncbi:hypothetical protein SAMN05216466_113114 [Paraburkholderia phenazinium]|uniref:Uncharacterized protein n=1 Tax=Paraburkholderia phenazinium TaxID=60549 RepID=A0A1G8FB34_9BURK|nr:hypothetical protein SAMN05216466_113114 [Paraburkholderia phenazinium]
MPREFSYHSTKNLERNILDARSDNNKLLNPGIHLNLTIVPQQRAGSSGNFLWQTPVKDAQTYANRNFTTKRIVI